MKPLSLAAHSFGSIWNGDATEAIMTLTSSGFSALELLASPGHLDIWQPVSETGKRLDRALSRSGAQVMALDITAHDYNLASLSAEVRSFSLRAYERLADLAQNVGATWLTVHGGRRIGFSPPPDDRQMGALRHAFDKLVEIAERRSLRLLIENIPMAVLNSASSIADFIDQGQWPHVDVAYDIANAVGLGEDPATGLRLLAGRTKVVHLSDSPRSSHGHLPIGEGDIDFQTIWTVVNEIGFDGWGVLEVASPQFASAMCEGVEALRAHGWRFSNWRGHRS